MEKIHFSPSFTSSLLNEWWAGQDLNLRPPPRKGGVLTRLDDRPTQPYWIKTLHKTLTNLASQQSLHLRVQFPEPLNTRMNLA